MGESGEKDSWFANLFMLGELCEVGEGLGAVGAAVLGFGAPPRLLLRLAAPALLPALPAPLSTEYQP